MNRLSSPPELARYLRRRGLAGPWTLEGSRQADLDGAVVIPALAESTDLPATLAALTNNPPELLERFLVVVVVNHRIDADPAAQEDNRQLLARLRAGDTPDGIQLAWIDAASPGRELPAGEGVGLARKLGCDLALERLGWHAANEPLLCLLDADTIVDADYLPAVVDHFRRTQASGAVLPFAHQAGERPEIEAAIVRYELYLRGYVLGLELAGSPYAYHTVGSTIACRAGAYLRVGGMNRRRAGEDFYFLQQLAKHGGVAPLAGTMVRPSARPSWRVPFGTGPSIRNQLEKNGKMVTCFPLAAFERLGRWLQLAMAAAPTLAGSRLLDTARDLDPALAVFLEEKSFAETWERLRRTHRNRAALARAFHVWFDGLKTLRLLRRFTDAGHAPGPPEKILPPLLAQAGLTPETDPGRQLALLRTLQNRMVQDRTQTGRPPPEVRRPTSPLRRKP
jgi:hypothetical protein